MSPLAVVILGLVTVFEGAGGPVYARLFRRHELGAEARAEQLAGHFEAAAAAEHLDAALLVALAYLESSLDPAAVEPSSGALGLLQLHPRSRWAREWRAACARAPSSCEAASVRVGARVLREGLDACPTEAEALGWYRVGRGNCIAGPRARLVLELRDRIREQLEPVAWCARGPESVRTGARWPLSRSSRKGGEHERAHQCRGLEGRACLG